MSSRGTFPRRAVGLAAVAAMLSATAVQSAPQAQPASPAGSGTISLMLGDLSFGLYETSLAADCPEGLNYKASESYNAQFPTPEARVAHEKLYGTLHNRGPNGVSAAFNPTLVKDPLPHRPTHSKVAIGLDLDGEQAGQGNGPSLPHENFTSPDGRKGIDNQLYRVVGCTSGWRKGGQISEYVKLFARTELHMRTLIEVTGVDSEINDPDVTITTWRGLDPVSTDTRDNLIPWMSYRIDYLHGARFIRRFKGRIVDGVLKSDPADVRLPAFDLSNHPLERDLKAMRLELKLTPTGAEGLIAGYLDVEDWYFDLARVYGSGFAADAGGWSEPMTYEALHKYADYRDPRTGKPGISAAYQVRFARGFIVHTDKGDASVASRLGGNRVLASQ